MEEGDYKKPPILETPQHTLTLTSAPDAQLDSKPHIPFTLDQPPLAESSKKRPPLPPVPSQDPPAYRKSLLKRPATRNDGYIPLSVEWAHLLDSKKPPTTVYLRPEDTSDTMDNGNGHQYYAQPQDTWQPPPDSSGEGYSMNEISQEYILNKERRNALSEVDNAKFS